jgi:hypothetical protein
MMTFGSLFSGIGGFDLFPFVTVYGVKINKSIFHKGNGNFFKLVMPKSMGFCICNSQIFRRIIVLVEVIMMDKFVFLKWSSPFACCYKDMFSHISRFVRIWMGWFKNIKISIAKICFFTSLFFIFANKNSTPFPRIIKHSYLISFGGNSRWYPHFFHCSPNNVLRSFIFKCNFLLGHFKFNVIPEKVFLFKRWFICILVHGGIISYASK